MEPGKSDNKTERPEGKEWGAREHRTSKFTSRRAHQLHRQTAEALNEARPHAHYGSERLVSLCSVLDLQQAARVVGGGHCMLRVAGLLLQHDEHRHGREVHLGLAAKLREQRDVRAAVEAAVARCAGLQLPQTLVPPPMYSMGVDRLILVDMNAV